MATRSNIGIKVDGIYQYIYCHWDGYPSHNGTILLQNYNTPEKVAELISGGEMSMLGPTLETCTFYHRDRGETFQPPMTTTNRDATLEQEWSYLFEDGKWMFSSANKPLWKELTRLDCF